MNCSNGQPLCTALALILSMQPVFAQSPSYSDTVAFILEKAGVRYEGSSGKYSIQSVQELSKCTLIVKQEHFNKHGKMQSANTSEVPFSKLDPSRTKTYSDQGTVYVYSLKSDPILQAQNITYAADREVFNAQRGNPTDFSCDRSKCVEYTSFPHAYFRTFDPQLNTPKLASALGHLIKICGGKGELF